MTRVLIAGAGVAAVECVLALRELAGARVEIELLAPAAELVHRPSSVLTPFGADAGGADRPRGRWRTGWSWPCARLARRRRARAPTTRSSRAAANGVGYDLLVVATGARSREAVPGAVTFRGPLSAGAVEGVLARAAAEPELRLVFAAPAGATLAAAALRAGAARAPPRLRERGVAEPDITVVTASTQPLEVLGRRRPATRSRRARATPGWSS